MTRESYIKVEFIYVNRMEGGRSMPMPTKEPRKMESSGVF